MVQLLNVRNFHSNKQNKDYSVLGVLRDVTPREKQFGLIGTTTYQEVFLPDNLVGKFNESHLGKDLDLQYTVVDGKAYLENVVVK